MARFAAFIYGVATYALMFLTFLYLFAFLANFQVPKTIDSGAPISPVLAALINLSLIALFAVPHSVMARPAFKQWWTQFIPKPIERTTYVLASTLLMILLFWQWQPMTQVVWQAQTTWANGLSWSLFVLGIVVLFASTFVIDHFDLFGLRQVTLNLKQKPYTNHAFKVTFFYKFVRHPIYVGWFLIFWATPTMTLGHLLTAVGMSTYILIAIGFEERDLVKYHGKTYENYRRRVPMLIPRLGTVHETVKPCPVEQAG
jgi:protein-S-isoprenylcysteine O-methyltransferase Ste14